MCKISRNWTNSRASRRSCARTFAQLRNADKPIAMRSWGDMPAASLLETVLTAIGVGMVITYIHRKSHTDRTDPRCPLCLKSS
jgi:hypothetical protein